jgi:hypothetical protein
MLGSEDYSEPRGRQVLQVQVPVAAMIVVRRRIGKEQAVKFRSNVAVEAVQNGCFAKRLHPDHWKIRKLMGWGKNRNIALFE